MPRGPLPKPDRARRNKPTIAARVVTLDPAPQPKLPTKWLDKAGDSHPMPAATKAWWKAWGASPLTAELDALGWSFLLDTAMLHAAYISGDHRLAAEIRNRVGKFGATPEDRARLRITVATADEVETRPSRPVARPVWPRLVDPEGSSS